MSWLHAIEKVVGHYGGRDYHFEKDDYIPVDDEAAYHMLKNRNLKLVDGPPKIEAPKVVCQVCEKDFSNAEDPEYSLRQHVKAAHRPKKEAEKDAE